MFRSLPGELNSKRGLRLGAAAACFLLLLSMSACTREQMGLPMTPVSAKSPDGRHIAFVRNHPSIDPPAQSLWLSSKGRSSRKIKSLGEDVDRCNKIVWSADSSTVSFLIQDARLITVDASSGLVVSELWLTKRRDGFPPSGMVSDMSLSVDGREANFRDCRREIEPATRKRRPADCGELTTVAIR
jgi:hypothetical protein